MRPGQSERSRRADFRTARAALVLGVALLASGTPAPAADEVPEALDGPAIAALHEAFRRGATASALPDWQEGLFTGSGACAACHSTAEGSPALLDAAGRDVAPPAAWRGTMMANSFRDPFFRARLAAEVARHPTLQAAIEDKCLTCHAPMARTQALADGGAGLSLAAAEASPAARDGVSCTLCHQIDPAGLGTPASYGGHYIIGTGRRIYGPYNHVLKWPMNVSVRYTAERGEHMLGSGLCGACHTLFTDTVDATTGAIVGSFPEQTPYLEWRNSVFAGAGPDARDCQDCHMPPIDDAVLLSNYPEPELMTAKSPFWRHHFVGGNAFMVAMIGDHAAELGATADTSHFESVIGRTTAQLRGASARLDVSLGPATATTLDLEVEVANLAGHKLPTAYPTRRVWLHVTVRDAAGVLLFESGATGPDGEIVGLDLPFEPHHQLLTSADQVQVWEAITGDTTGAVTYGLLTAATYLKDNRIPPRGFSSTGPDYAHTAPAGGALTDPDFNRDPLSGLEGSGADRVTYRLPIGGGSPPLRVVVRLLYFPVMPRAVEDLAAWPTAETARFATWWSEASKEPIEMARREKVLYPSIDSGWLLR